jgi:hypothetical protein
LLQSVNNPELLSIPGLTFMALVQMLFELREMLY